MNVFLSWVEFDGDGQDAGDDDNSGDFNQEQDFT